MEVLIYCVEMMFRGSFGDDFIWYYWKIFTKMLAEGEASTDVGLVDQISSVEEEEEENEGLLSISFL